MTSRQLLEYKFADGDGYGKWYTKFPPEVVTPPVGVTVDKNGMATGLLPWTSANSSAQSDADSVEFLGTNAARGLSAARDAISTYFKLRNANKQPKWPNP